MSWLDAPKSEHEVRREHFVAGVETERERIIALLEKLTWTRNCLYTETIDCTLCRINVHDAIAHIKEENK